MKFFIFILFSCFLSSTANAGILKLSEIPGYKITDMAQLGDVWHDDYGGYSGGDFTGYYLGTIDGNDKESDLETLISYYFDDTPYDIVTLEKVEAPATSSGPFSVIYDNPATSG